MPPLVSRGYFFKKAGKKAAKFLNVINNYTNEYIFYTVQYKIIQFLCKEFKWVARVKTSAAQNFKAESPPHIPP